MTKVAVTKSKLDDLALHISMKSGESMPLTIDEMQDAVDGIELPSNQSKTVSPATSQQVVEPDTGYTGLSEVTVNAISPVRTSANLTVDGSWVTVPAGWYATPVNKQVALMTLPTSASTTASGTNKATIAASTSTRYINIPTGYNTAYARYTLSAMPTMTLPTAASSTSSGTSRATINPSESDQYINIPTGYNSAGAYYLIKAIASMTLPTQTSGSGTGTEVKQIDANALVDMYLNIPIGYNSTASYYKLKKMPSGSIKTPDTSISANPTISIDNNGLITANVSGSQSVSPTIVSPGYVDANTGTISAGTISVSGSATSQMTVRTSSDLTASGLTVNAPAGYYQSAATKTLTDANLIAGNIKKNVSIFGVTGSYEGDGGGGGDTGLLIAYSDSEPSSASSSIQFTGLSAEPSSFIIMASEEIATGTPARVAAVVFDGMSLHGQTITNTSNAQVSADTSFTKSYSNGTLTVTATSAQFQPVRYLLEYTYGGGSIGTKDVQVGSGATSISFTGLNDEPVMWSCIFKSNFSTSSGYQRVIAAMYIDGDNIGLSMDSSAKFSDTNFSASYSNGTLTITSNGTNAGGYFHQPGYYQLTYAIDGEASPVEIEPLSVTENGTYQESGKAYSPVVVNVPSGGGSANIDTKTVTASNRPTSLSFSSMKGQPKAFVLRCTSSMSRSSSSTYYYVAMMRYDGTSTTGNCWRMSNGNWTNITSGYSFTYSGTTLTVTSSGTTTTSPGCFYPGNYELVYIY